MDTKETFVYACIAPPGPHVIIVYDPRDGAFYKKLITINQKEPTKDYHTKRLDNEYDLNKN